MSSAHTAAERRVPHPGMRVPELDGVRGVAILLVMLCHFTLYGGLEPVSRFEHVFARTALTGWVGVDLFFVLSGFLITGILYDTKGAAQFFKNFYVRRLVRIFPLYYGFLIGFFVVLPALYPGSWVLRTMASDQVWYWSYLSNLLISLRGWPEAPGTVGHFWSLAVEEHFYLIWPFVVFLFSRRRLVQICVGLMAFSFAVRIALVSYGEMTAAYAFTPARADTLAVGAWVALVARGPNGLDSLTRWGKPVAIATLVYLLALFASRGRSGSEDWAIQIFGYTPIAVFFGALLVIVLGTRRGSLTSRILSGNSLRQIGKYSYGIYVFHLPLTTVLARHVLGVGDIPKVLGTQLFGQAVFYVMAGSASVAAAFVSWHLFEWQFLRLKKYVPYHRPPRRVSTPPAARKADELAAGPTQDSG